MSSVERKSLVLCVGICCVDVIHVCEKYPGEDSDLRSKHGRWQRGGNPSNNCTVLALMDQTCEYLGTFSSDVMYGPIINDFKRRGILTRHCAVQDDVETPLSSVLISLQTGTRTIVHSNPNLRELTIDDFRRCNLAEYKWIHFEPRTKEVAEMMKMVRDWNLLQCSDSDEKHRICVSLELEKPEKHPLEFAELCDVLFIGKVYAEEVLQANNMEDAIRKAHTMIRNKNIKLICAWGSEGAAALDNLEDIIAILISPACPPPIILDTLGAGDTFCAAVIYALANGKSLQNALQFGNQIAGAKIGFYGYDEIKEIYKGFL